MYKCPRCGSNKIGAVRCLDCGRKREPSDPPLTDSDVVDAFIEVCEKAQPIHFLQELEKVVAMAYELRGRDVFRRRFGQR